MGVSTGRILLGLFFGFPVFVLVVYLSLKSLSRKLEGTGCLGIVVVLVVVAAEAFLVNLLLNGICSLLGWGAKGPWHVFIF